MPRHRTGKIKTQHAILDGLLPYLERLAEMESVKTIIPARIIRAHKVGTRGARIKIKISGPTPTGLRLQAASARYAQEIYVVTNDPHSVASSILSGVLDEE